MPARKPPISIEVTSESGGEVLPAIARARIVARLKRWKLAEIEAVPGYLARKQGVFVTIRTIEDNQLRGCIGTVEPETESLIEETQLNAHAAAFEDSRFKPLMGKELDLVRIEVCVLAEPERVHSIAELDPEIYGAILTSRTSGKRGVMLPDIPGLNTVDKQLAEIRRKAEIRPDEDLRIERFRVEKFVEEI